MVAPVIGPLNSSSSGPYSTLSRTKYKQAKPYDLDLPYTHLYYYGWDIQGNSEGWLSGQVKNTSFGFWSNPGSLRLYNDNYNKTYEKFFAKLSDQAGWAENLAQMGKTRDMFSARANQAWEFVNAVRRFKFKRAAKILRTPVPSGVSHQKAVAQNILEFEYGLRPLLMDLESSLKIITAGPPTPIKIKVSNQSAEHVLLNEAYEGGSSRAVQFFEVRHYMWATVSVDNPDLLLANRLGLTDLALPWKLLPFSFVVDWFVNVEQVLSSLSDTWGLTLTQPGYTWIGRSRNSRTGTSYYKVNGVDHYAFSTRYQSAVEMSRQQGIPGPTLIVKPFRGFSIERGIQAISLVVAVLGK